jgi:hypothetical protein
MRLPISTAPASSPAEDVGRADRDEEEPEDARAMAADDITLSGPPEQRRSSNKTYVFFN